MAIPIDKYCEYCGEFVECSFGDIPVSHMRLEICVKNLNKKIAKLEENLDSSMKKIESLEGENCRQNRRLNKIQFR